jgi:hypothetical protein
LPYNCYIADKEKIIMNMKKNLLYMLVAGIILSVSACKSSESAYRQAYEKAIQGDEQKETAVVEQPVPHVLEVQTPAAEESAPVAVREEKVNMATAKSRSIKPLVFLPILYL